MNDPVSNAQGANSSGRTEVDVEQAPVQDISAATPAASFNGSTCTVCSICIDDFEPGEELTLLPRCQHCFHKD
jgi:hypothetical protein